MTLVSLINEIQRVKSLKGTKLISYAHGPVIFDGVKENRICVIGPDEKEYTFDDMGRLFPEGMCLIYPEGYNNWSTYKETCITEYYNSLLRKEEVCLVKETETSEWILAIYKGRWAEGFSAQRGKTSEVFQYCIAYSGNEDRLGRVSFPEWMGVDSDNEEQN